MPLQIGWIISTFSHFFLVQSTKIFLKPEGTPSQNPGLGALDFKQPNTKFSLSPLASKSSRPSLSLRLSPSLMQSCWFIVFPNSKPSCIFAAVRGEDFPDPVNHEAIVTTTAITTNAVRINRAMIIRLVNLRLNLNFQISAG